MTGKTTRTKWLRPVHPAGAIALLALGLWLLFAGASPAAAEDNVVSTFPASTLMPPGGEVNIAIRADPPAETLAVWIVEVSFDPAVVTAESVDCDPINTPSGFVGASGCEVVDTDGDDEPDTAKIFGAMISQGTGTGLTQVVTLADITFHVVGQARDCTPFRLAINIHADDQGDETGALVQDGRGCVAGAAPPGGTAEPTEAEVRTSDPTPAGGVTVPPLGTPDNGNNGGQTEETPAGVTVPGQTAGDTGAGNGGNSTDGPGGTNGGPTEGQGGVVTEDGDGGGVGAIVWVLVGVLALGAAGGGAWAIVRRGGEEPPSTPEGG